MKQRRLAVLFFLLSLGLAASAAADPIAALMSRVVTAIGRDDVTAFDPLVVPHQAFGWGISVVPVIVRFRCPEIERWSFAVMEQTTTVARVRLTMEAHARRAGSGIRSPMPRVWIAELQQVEGRWYLRSLVTLERDLARRIVLACPDQRAALFESDPDADQHALIYQIAESATSDFLSSVTLQEARVAVEFACQEAERLGDLGQEAVALATLTSALRLFGAREESLTLAEEAVDLAERSGEADPLATSYFCRGLGRWVNGDRVGAQEDLDAAGRLAHVNDDVLGSLKAMAMSAYIALSNRDYRHAVVRADRLDALSREVGWGEGGAYACYVRADIHFALRDFAAARELYERVRAIGIPLHVDFARGALIDVARCDLALGDVGRAERELGSVEWGSGAKPLANIAEAFISIGNLRKAELILTRALANADGEDDTQGVSDAYTAKARLRLAQRRPEEALAAARAALRYGLHGKAPLIEWSAWRAEASAARALRALGRQREARAALESAIDLVEQLRAVVVSDPSAARYFEDKADLYADLMETDLALGDVRGALAASERLRARTLRDSLSQAAFDRKELLTAAERARQDAAEKRLEAANRKVLAAGGPATPALREERDRARLALDQVSDELMLRHPELRVRRADFRPLLSLPASFDDTAVLEYAVTARATYLFTLVRRGKATEIGVARIAVTRAELTAAVDRLGVQLARRDFRYNVTASRLYDLLVAPAVAAIGAHRQLCIIPDDTLWRLPFQVLTDRHGVDLVSKLPISYAPALTLLTSSAAPRAPAGGRTLLAFANPRSGDDVVAQMRALFRGASLGALPDAETEVARIAALYGKARSKVYIGASAREWTFKHEARAARIIHVATHGVIDDRAPLYSALLFAPGGPDGDDGLLEAREVLDLRFDADLVVLSACDTARGRIGAGEGVIGLSWAFLVAGCRTLVVAQMPAETKSTAALMVEFHRRLREGLSPAAALQQAQLALRRDPRFAHPFYWAPFVVIGDGFAPV